MRSPESKKPRLAGLHLMLIYYPRQTIMAAPSIAPASTVATSYVLMDIATTATERTTTAMSRGFCIIDFINYLYDFLLTLLFVANFRSMPFVPKTHPKYTIILFYMQY